MSISPSQTNWFYADANNQTVGPVSFDELNRLSEEGAIRGGTLVIEEAGSDWKQFSSLTAAVAPPLPEVKRKKPWWMLFLLFFCFPIGLIFIWRSKVFTKKEKIILTGIFGVVFLLFGIFGTNSNLQPDSPVAAEVSVKDQVSSMMKAIFHENLRDVDVAGNQHEGYTVVVDFNVPGRGLWGGAQKERIDADAKNAYKELYTSNIQVRQAGMVGYARLIDRFGKESDEKVYYTLLEDETAKRIQWKNYEMLDFSLLWKVVFIHPAVEQ